MAVYFPQAVCRLQPIFEDFDLPRGRNLANQTFNMTVQCEEVEIMINDITEANQFRVKIDYKTLPFDPRTMRSCRITIYMENQKSVFLGNKHNQIVPSRNNIVFIGFVDIESITMDERQRSVMLKGRDLTSVFLDLPYTGKHLDLSRRLDLVVQDLIDQTGIAGRAILIDTRIGENERLPIINSSLNKNNTASAGNIPKDSNFWDMITKVVTLGGLICYMDLDRLVITKPRILYNPDSIGTKARPKLFIYGKNVVKMNVERRLGRYRNYNLVLRSLNLHTGKITNVSIPKDATVGRNFGANAIGGKHVMIKRINANGSLETEIAPSILFTLPNLKNKEEIVEVGEQLFEEMARQDLEGSLETMEMTLPEIVGKQRGDFKTNLVNFSEIKNGTPIEIYIDTDDMDKIRSTASLSQRERYLIQRGYTKKVARVFALSQNLVKNRFYVKGAIYRLSQSGFSLTVDFINYVETSLRRR